MVNSNMLVRLYRSTDRAAVRDIAVQTANRGESAESVFPDREILADLLTAYYTDYEPQSLWVAEDQGKAIGYLTGCLNRRRYLRLLILRIVSKIAVRTICRGLLGKMIIWEIFWSAIKLFFRGQYRQQIDFNKYPAHLHINIKEGYRRQKIGGLLMRQFIAQVKSAALNGVYLSVWKNNVQARRFFEHFGFKELNRYQTIHPGKDSEIVVYVVRYGMEVQ